jgi:hypothetical protein
LLLSPSLSVSTASPTRPMANPIGPDHGIEAARKRELELHPQFPGAWNKRSDTLLKLVAGHNETIDELQNLRREILLRPFG